MAHNRPAAVDPIDSAEIFRCLFDESPTPMWIVDAEFQRIQRANGAARQLLGLGDEDLPGAQLGEFLPEEDCAALAAMPLNSDSQLARHCTLRTRSDDAFQASLNIRRMQAAGRAVALVSVESVDAPPTLQEKLRAAVSDVAATAGKQTVGLAESARGIASPTSPSDALRLIAHRDAR
ncbi:MAG: PAS domain-containing protein, partial [Planctomycetales bacterium]|nr:PAS domain-containing protein [Planctomycetales bacterium]